jgi:hypothetical protein
MTHLPSPRKPTATRETGGFEAPPHSEKTKTRQGFERTPSCESVAGTRSLWPEVNDRPCGGPLGFSAMNRKNYSGASNLNLPPRAKHPVGMAEIISLNENFTYHGQSLIVHNFLSTWNLPSGCAIVRRSKRTARQAAVRSLAPFKRRQHGGNSPSVKTRKRQHGQCTSNAIVQRRHRWGRFHRLYPVPVPMRLSQETGAVQRECVGRPDHQPRHGNPLHRHRRGRTGKTVESPC